MRKHTKILAGTVVLATAGWFAGCNGTIDEVPNVVLEVELVTIPPISGARNAVTNECVFTLTNASATFKNKPKNSLAETSPFNDIVLQSLDVVYTWDDGFGETAATFGIGGTVPANASATSQFAVVNASDLRKGDLSADPPTREGHTARLQMIFRGATVSGDPVSAITGGSLTVNSCQ